MALPRWLRNRRGGGDRTPETIYAIGDIHGQVQKLHELVALIEGDLARHPRRRVALIVLGDFIDRGPGSRTLIDLFMQLRARPEIVVLKGNHEAAMVAALRGDHDALGGWLANGGDATLAAYGVDLSGVDFDDTGRILRSARRAVPESVVGWLERLPLSVRHSGYYFVHAGVRPGVPLDAQAEDDLLWIRDVFTRSTLDHGAVVVHGHSLSPDGVCFAGNRIGVDTGAYLTGRLSAVVIDGDALRALTTDP